jgi:hypothetical protein
VKCYAGTSLHDQSGNKTFHLPLVPERNISRSPQASSRQEETGYEIPPEIFLRNAPHREADSKCFSSEMLICNRFSTSQYGF